MKRILVALTIVLAVVLTIMVLKQEQETAPPMSALDAIMTRTSVRSYTSEKVNQDQIETILRAGMAAPTAGNRQPWEFVVVTDRELLDKIPTVVTTAKMAPKSQLAIVACGVPEKSFPGVLADFWIQDVSAATENMLLAAHAIGLGAVWCSAFPDLNGRIKGLQELFELPEGVIPLSIVVIGHLEGETTPKDKWDPNKVNYNKYAN